ncbi:hypothetical protein [Brevundimonas lenta]|uniref:Uncharacterized protein n=1 Tax=Brevundimonas lenta TaxID=424796 RepID=A0A7W6NN19_9CAUL|nr:hypothetical protein [Brevundimonas lenta]MBB4081333.1 hypothetical protein [Brevundimonas lenta]
MELTHLPADLLSAAKAGDFPAGTLIFTPYAWYGEEPLQLGIRVGDEGDIFALTDWHGGRSKAGTIVTTRGDRPVFGFQHVARLYLNPSTSTVAINSSRAANGFVALSSEGLVLASIRPDPNFHTMSYPYLIDPRTWQPLAASAQVSPEVWFDDWQIRIELSGNETFVASIARQAD